jgi:hypothetical protein
MSSSKGIFNLLHFVGGAEAVEEVQEGDARLQGGGLGDQGEVHDFLDVVGAEHGPAGGAAGHDVGVVAEDDSAWAAMARADTWKTVEVSSPAILYMLGIISNSP